jgi:hypothetical protein
MDKYWTYIEPSPKLFRSNNMATIWEKMKACSQQEALCDNSCEIYVTNFTINSK